jgi:hypothetical protein
MKCKGYICIYLFALYTSTISSSLSVGKFYFAQQEKLLAVKDGCFNTRYKKGRIKIKKNVTKKAVCTCSMLSDNKHK